MNSNSLHDKIALVTGAASGIGRETALAFGRRGADLVIADLDEEFEERAVKVEGLYQKGVITDDERRQELLDHMSSRGMIGGEVYRSDDAGLTWTKASPDGESIGGGPAYYYGQIIIDPNDPESVHVLSAASWGTTRTAPQWPVSCMVSSSR